MVGELRLDDIALFLDLDGTLLEFVADPQTVRIDDELRRQLQLLHQRTDGALAIVSGRPIAELDRLLAPLLLPLAGLHGFERRNAQGFMQRQRLPTSLAPVADRLRKQIRHAAGILLEDKGAALAVHYRNAPSQEPLVRSLIAKVLPHLPPDFEPIEGACVIEFKPAGCSKGMAVSAFMAEPPFTGRTPVYVGDDATDQDGFAAARRHAGVAIAVGDRVHAPYRLENPASVRRWLDQLTINARFSP
jgi:trehalose 6-phosphate phosphatase